MAETPNKHVTRLTTYLLRLRVWDLQQLLFVGADATAGVAAAART